MPTLQLFFNLRAASEERTLAPCEDVTERLLVARGEAVSLDAAAL
jgi:hypothetical protein